MISQFYKNKLFKTITGFFSVAEIGESCTGSKFCRPVSSRCDHVKGECTCQNGYSASSSNNKVIYCKQKPLLSTSTSFSLLKEPCDDNRQKCSPENHLECDKGVCVCSNGYKEASIDIINAYPFNVVQCVPVNFSIGKHQIMSICFYCKFELKTTCLQINALCLQSNLQELTQKLLFNEFNGSIRFPTINFLFDLVRNYIILNTYLIWKFLRKKYSFLT